MDFSKRSRSEWFQLLVLVLLIAAFPLLLPSDRKDHGAPRAVFDQALLEKMRRRGPNICMIGNSMLDTRIDKLLFNQLTRPNSTSFIADGGTRSTVWYFKLKNFAGALNPPPKVVFIFYRDYDFTRPWLHLEGERLETARTFMKPEDEDVLAFARKLGGVAPASGLDFYWPEQLTLDLRKRVSRLAIDAGAIGQGKTGDTLLEEQLNELFDFQNLRANVFDAGAAANDLVPADTKRFTADPASNLLTQFDSFARERGIRLVFYRVKRRPNDQNEVIQDADLRAYTADFQAWAERQGHALIDETGDPRLTLSMYHDGDHLGKHAMAEYTRLFLERVKMALPLPPAP